MGLDGIRLAVGTLTVIPVGVVTLNPATARRAMLLAPVAVLPVAGASAAAGWLTAARGAPDLLIGLVVLAASALLTRGLHLDGLADTADGFGSGWDPEKALAVMRRGDVGPMGVVTLVLVLGVQAATVGALLQGWRGALLVTVVWCCSRAAVVLVCRVGVPPARADGLGAPMAQTVPTTGAVAVWLGVTILLTVVGGWAGLVAAVLAVGAVLLLVRRAVSRFGGVTGDVMGAAIEVAGTAMLIVLVLW